MSKILITGATGTTGRQVTLSLAQAGADVRAGVRDLGKAADLAEAGAELVRLDWSDPSSIAAAFEGVERLFLLTPFVEEPFPMVEAAVAAARSAGVKHIVRMSAAGADASADFALAREHGRAEEAVKASGIGWTILRPSFFLDNFLHFGPASTVKAEGRFYGASGQGKAAYISTADIAAAAAAILGEPEAHAAQTYALTGGEALADAEVAALLGELLGKPVTFVDLTLEQQRAALEGQKTPEWMIDAFLGLESVKRSGGASTISPALQTLLGRSPETARAFLQRNLSAFR